MASKLREVQTRELTVQRTGGFVIRLSRCLSGLKSPQIAISVVDPDLCYPISTGGTGNAFIRVRTGSLFRISQILPGRTNPKVLLTVVQGVSVDVVNDLSAWSIHQHPMNWAVLNDTPTPFCVVHSTCFKPRGVFGINEHHKTFPGLPECRNLNGATIRFSHTPILSNRMMCDRGGGSLPRLSR